MLYKVSQVPAPNILSSKAAALSSSAAGALPPISLVLHPTWDMVLCYRRRSLSAPLQLSHLFSKL